MEEIIVREVTAYSPELAKRVRELAQMIGKNVKPLSEDDFKEILASPNTILLLAFDQSQTIVGMATLATYRIPYVRKAYVEDIVVDPDYRGKGIGKKLLQGLIDEAKKKDVAYLDLTTRPRREEGNNLYETMGFQKRDTNVFRMIFDYGEL